MCYHCIEFSSPLRLGDLSDTKAPPMINSRKEIPAGIPIYSYSHLFHIYFLYSIYSIYSIYSNLFQFIPFHSISDVVKQNLLTTSPFVPFIPFIPIYSNLFHLFQFIPFIPIYPIYSIYSNLFYFCRLDPVFPQIHRGAAATQLRHR